MANSNAVNEVFDFDFSDEREPTERLTTGKPAQSCLKASTANKLHEYNFNFNPSNEEEDLITFTDDEAETVRTVERPGTTGLGARQAIRTAGRDGLTTGTIGNARDSAITVPEQNWDCKSKPVSISRLRYSSFMAASFIGSNDNDADNEGSSDGETAELTTAITRRNNAHCSRVARGAVARTVHNYLALGGPSQPSDPQNVT